MTAVALLLLSSLQFVPHAVQIERGEPLKRSAFLGVQSAPADGGKGLRVVRVIPGGTGEALGLKEGDVLTSVNGTPVLAPPQLQAALRGLKANDPLMIAYVREGKEARADGRAAARPMQIEQGLDVVYDQVVSRGKRIRVMVTKPQGQGRFPALLYIGGIGAYSLDGSFSNIFPAAGRLLEPVARAGYVTVRIDKPGQGDSEGPLYRELEFGVEKDTYVQALRLAKSYPYVDKDRIAIFGHSMGGCFGPLVAAEEPVKAVIVTGTLFKTFGEYMLENTRRQAEMSGASPEEVDRSGRDTLRATHYLFHEGLTPRQLAEKHPDLAGWVRSSVPDGETYSGVGIPFFRELANTNLAAAWAKVDADVLAIYCANDFLSGQDDHERIASAMNQKRPGSGEFKLLPDSDHLFRKTTSPSNSMQTWGQPGEFNPSIAQSLVDYLKRKLG
jgi:hypothetical protein